MRTEKQLQRRALQILKRVGITGPHVPVLRVARELGVEVRPEFAEDDVSGGLYRKKDGIVIGVNAAHHPNRQRFTVAHELGHLVLHEGSVYVDRSFASERPDEGAPAFLRSRVSSEAVDPVEIEANRFAACLLMPRPFLFKDVEKMSLPLDSEGVEELARSYQVSVQAMTYRLTNVGIPFDVGF